MSNIINFNKNKTNDKINDKLLEIFDNIDKYIKKNKEHYIEQFGEYYEKLYKYFYEVYSKLKDDKRYNISNNIFLKKFSDVTTNDTIENQHINELEYIRLYDMLKKDFIKLEPEYIKMLLFVPFEFEDLSISMYKQIVDYLANPIVKESINKKENFESKMHLFIDYVDCIEHGDNDILEYALSEINEVPQEFDDLKSGILTIDRIHKYYIGQAYLFRYSFDYITTDETIKSIDKIIKIKAFDNSIQVKFIELMKISRELSKNLEDELNFMSDLTEIFLYFGEKIDKIKFDTLKTILFYNRINKANIKETIEYFEQNRKVI